eukprot:TRINITY_DN4922_c0_g1_i1.p1 TRINITY_DN4922_c0_g1~~TRINITY_DN4922_c0_g1_i1.p1  ORF type:complete len:430 (+),score=111.73 TRINITY_DN4922_c0_g1_i1:60-1292(+)
MAQFKVRGYLPEDDSACKALELRANQGGKFPALQRFTEFFFRVHFVHHREFDSKVRQFEDWVIKVAERTSNKQVVGVVCAAIKTVSLHGKPVKMAMIFDLRVDDRFQGNGIGKLLSEDVESECIARGAEAVYLSVNKHNTKARSLYKTRGFSDASERAPCIKILVNSVKERPDDFSPSVPVTKDEAMKAAEESLGCTDMALKDMRALYDSEWYEGTVRVDSADRRSTASVSLWNGSGLSGIALERVLYPVSWWSHPLSTLFWSIVVTAAAVWYGHGLYSAVRSAAFWRIGVFGVLGVAIGAASYFVLPVALHVRRVLKASRPMKLRMRLFAFHHSGPEGAECMKEAVGRAYNIARDKGFAMTVTNIDNKHPLKSCFANATFGTLFLQKSLSAGQPTTPFSSDNFFDPRDI